METSCPILSTGKLYFQDIQSFDVLVCHIDFYVKEQNELIPFLALGGATPVEIYISAAAAIIDKVKQKEIVRYSIQMRIQFHQELNCSKC